MRHRAIFCKLLCVSVLYGCGERNRQFKSQPPECELSRDVASIVASPTHVVAVEQRTNHVTVTGMDPLQFVDGQGLYEMGTAGPVLTLESLGIPSGTWNGGAIDDLDGDGVEDMVVAGSAQEPGLWFLSGPVGTSTAVEFLGAGQELGALGSTGFGVVQSGARTRMLAVAAPSSERGGVVLLGVEGGDDKSLVEVGLILASQPYEDAGESVDTRADLNGDGLKDLVYADFFAGHSRLMSGAVFIEFAPVRTNGVVSDADLVFDSGSAEVSNFGYDVSAGGDIDGDGMVDLAVSAAFANGDWGIDSPGAVYLFTGIAQMDTTAWGTVEVPGELDNATRTIELAQVVDEVGVAGLLVHDHQWVSNVEAIDTQDLGTVLGIAELSQGRSSICSPDVLFQTEGLGNGWDEVRRLDVDGAAGWYIRSSIVDGDPSIAVWAYRQD